ncbi:MAG: hypothetical protein ABIR62_00140 [Dokdonella sp.]|uniref:hypothetical protein n=1 Tax=Dokdonella sp. TaxID=2291710 RepID=UPI0032679D40
MPTRLIRLVFLAATLSFTGAAVVAFSGSGLIDVPAGAAVAAGRDTLLSDPLHTTLMPSVRVHPEVEIPTLATVTVRPMYSEVSAVSASSPNALTSVSVPMLARRSTGGLMASAGFDMPYYSFGKTLRHVSKE